MPHGEPLPHPLLDDMDAMCARDCHDIMKLTTGFAAQCRDAVRIGKEFASAQPAAKRPIRNVVMTGMGGSAIGGDLLRAIMDSFGSAPMVVNRDYDLPAFVGPDSLVLAASYSGNTEETLSAYAQALARKAQIVCITSGGELAGRAAADGVAVIHIPGGQPPRTATGYMFFPMLAALSQRGLLDHDLGKEISAALDMLDRLAIHYGPGTTCARNPAKQLAVALHSRIPVIYGTHGYCGTLAVRWKGQFNENAKVHAFANSFPEQNHNEILAWTLSKQQASRWSVVYLRDPDEEAESPRIAKRVEVTEKIIGRAAKQHEVWAQGDSLLERMFSLFTLGDFVTVYAAYLYNIDPTDIIGIDRLKAELAKLPD